MGGVESPRESVAVKLAGALGIHDVASVRRKHSIRRIGGIFMGSMLGMLAAGAAESSWEDRLARSVSGRLQKIDEEVSGLRLLLGDLPDIPIDNQGGTGGFCRTYPSPAPGRGSLHAVEVLWGEVAKVEAVALVPARRYDARGLDPHFGMPDRFRVEFVDLEGKTVRVVAQENHARSHPVRRGHPFLYRVAPPVEAAGLRICAELLAKDSDGDSNYVHAWAEVFAFGGGKNLAYGADVHPIGGSAASAPWHWKTEFLVDGQTPLGLPEVPAKEHRNVGWLSNGRAKADEGATLTIDLGSSTAIDGVRLLPARRPTSDLPSGFGFPRSLEISISETGTPDDWRTLFEGDFRNPGHNPVLVPFDPVRGRHLRIEATRLWKEFESYPSFFALSEVEVLGSGVNFALGKVVRSPDGMLNMIAPGGKYWSGAALSDGFGPDGRLVSVDAWLAALDRRLELETRGHQLRLEAAGVINRWRSAGLSAFGLLGLSGLFALIAVPIRYRIHANRELMKVRERIAGDLHDEVGSNLGSIQMLADLAEGRSGASEELRRIQRIASETVSAVRDIVWLLRPGGDHRIGTVEHLRETGSIMLESLKWKFSANEPSWLIELPEEDNRDLFLFYREALHNIMRHANATRVEIHAETTDSHFTLSISDNGCGIRPEKMGRPATLRALRQRAESLGAELRVVCPPDGGTNLTLLLPLGRRRLKKTRSISPPGNTS